MKPTSTIATSTEAGSTPDARIEAAYAELHAALRADLLDRIAGNTPLFFERLIVDLLVSMGYGGTHKNAAQQLGRSGDGGVDGVINEDRLGLDRVYVQAKRYATGNLVGRPDVQGFVGSLVGLGATKGVFVTTSSFSIHARDFVKHLTQRVILIDGETLADLMIEHGVGVRTAQTIAIKRLDEDFFLRRRHLSGAARRNTYENDTDRHRHHSVGDRGQARHGLRRHGERALYKGRGEPACVGTERRPLFTSERGR